MTKWPNDVKCRLRTERASDTLRMGGWGRVASPSEPRTPRETPTWFSVGGRPHSWSRSRSKSRNRDRSRIAASGRK
jgi:hypothetical protein